MDIPTKKIRTMQCIYLQKNSALYSEEEIKTINYYLDTICYKFHLANMSLQQLWSLSDNKKYELYLTLKNSLDTLSTNDNDLLIISFALENFLFLSKSFLDIYMLYILILLKTGFRGNMTTKKFFKKIKNISDESFSEKAIAVEVFFHTHVFGDKNWTSLYPNDWGSLLESLRNKIAHKDRIRPSFNSSETLIGKVLFDWPTLQDITYDRFCQYMQNGMFDLFKSLSPILYDLDWKSGSYQDNFWN